MSAFIAPGTATPGGPGTAGGAAASSSTALKVARARHPWSWVISAVAIILLAQFIHGIAINPGWDRPARAGELGATA